VTPFFLPQSTGYPAFFLVQIFSRFFFRSARTQLVMQIMIIRHTDHAHMEHGDKQT
jgi:hypothetical protein